MKRKALSAVWLFAASSFLSCHTTHAQSWLPAYDELLNTYRSDTGVNYRKWTKSPADFKKLDTIVNQLASQSPPDGNDASELAYYANAYNILVLHGVLAAYPIESVKDIAFNFGFFSEKRFVLAGEKISLNEIEKERLLKAFGDARIHFIINCASVSCPPLPASALTSENLGATMQTSTATFLNHHPEGVQVISAQHYRISKIFDWYRKDFEASAGSITTFLNRYLTKPLSQTAKVSYLNYDWQLNQSESNEVAINFGPSNFAAHENPNTLPLPHFPESD